MTTDTATVIDQLEELTRTQLRAIASVPLDRPVPKEVLALLATAGPRVQGTLTPLEHARLAGVHAALDEMIAIVERRQVLVQHRLRDNLRAQRGPAVAHRWDSLG